MAFEEAQRKDPDSLKRFLRKEMEGSSVVCALAGAETALRRWVRFEIMQGIWDERGIFGVRIHTIADLNQTTATAGPNPFDLLGVFVDDKKMYFTERATASDKWSYTNHRFRQADAAKVGIWGNTEQWNLPAQQLLLAEFIVTHRSQRHRRLHRGRCKEYEPMRCVAAQRLLSAKPATQEAGVERRPSV